MVVRTALVTGAASGFGRALGRRLAEAGWRVVATDERPPADWASAGLLARRLDVRSESDVARVLAEFGDLDLLVNNAGYAAFGTQEELPLDVVADLFDVNVLGVARCTRAALPGLRRRRGAVVMLSSVAGRTVFPESGYYAATKHAVEALSEALAQETATAGVRVRVIEPGAFATGFGARADRESPRPGPESPYAAERRRWQARKSEVLSPPQDPELVAGAIVASLDDPAPFRRVVVGEDARRILALRDALGPDPWTRLAVDRQGFVGPHDPDDVPDPATVLALPEGDPRLARARLAARLGHLGHWDGAVDDGGRPVGALALARLAADL